VNLNTYNFNHAEPLDHLVVADAMVGLNERSDRNELKNFLGVDPVSYEWCAAFVNGILNIHGIPGSESVHEHPLLARSFLSWGVPVETPSYGDVVIFPRGSEAWQGHVGFYVDSVKVDGVEHYIILGGNQDNTISYDLYPAKRALGIRRIPKD
jgi:uncharacterized protein (TIGR02594 family)